MEALSALLGLHQTWPTLSQMVARAIVVYLFALVVVRLGDSRFLGKHGALDVILGFMLGAVLSRAITGNAPFVPALVSAAALVALHWLFAAMAFRSTRFASLVEGDTRVLVRDGEILWDQMRASSITLEDLRAALRKGVGVEDPSRIRIAHRERDGTISAIPIDDGPASRAHQPRVIEVRVEEGVQTVRVRLE